MREYKIALILLFIVPILFSCSSKKDSPKEFDIERINVKQKYILVDSLSLDDYSEIEGYIPQTGLIPTADMAIQIAEIILINIYGKENIEEQRPFSINLENNIWIIEGHLGEGYLGGVAYIEIDKINGKILKVIHTK
jgi:hypothetical protein